MTMKNTALAILVMLGGVAAADKNKDKADALFKEGKKLMGEKRYSEACQALEDSFKLDPGIGGELNIAKCYEEWGKLGRAYKAYKHASEMAHQGNDPRAPKIDELITNLDKDLPHLTIKMPKGADPIASGVTLDGSPVDQAMINTPQVVDPGPHTVEWKTDAGGKKNKIVPIERGGASEVAIDATGKSTVVANPDANKPPPVEKPKKVEEGPPPGRNMRIAGLAVGWAGVVAIGVASYMTLSARSSYNDALSKHCGGMTNGCDDIGLTQTHDARHEANVATIVFVLGTAAVGGGVALYLLAPHGDGRSGHRESADESGFYVVPSVSPEGGGIVIGGRM